MRAGTIARDGPRLRPAVQEVTLDDERSLHAVTAGTGADIVLLHGALATHQDWLDGPFEALAPLGRTIAVDRPGHGLSRRPRFAGDPRVQARQLRDGLRALGVARPLLVGHSAGCLLALAFAEQFSGECAGLVLLAPLAFPEVRPLEHLWLAPRATPVLGPLWEQLTPRALDRAALAAAHRVMFRPDRPDPAWQRHYPWDRILAPKAMIANAEDAAAVHPLSGAAGLNLAALRTPARIVSGGADRVIWGSHQAIRLQAALPDAVHRRIEGAGHMIHRSHMAVLVEAVREALGL